MTIESLPGMHKALGLIASIHKLGVVAHTYNLSTQRAEVGVSEVEGHPCLHRELETKVNERLPSSHDLGQTRVPSANGNHEARHLNARGPSTEKHPTGVPS